MTDNFSNEQFEAGENEDQQNGESPKALREAANRGAKYKNERDALARENAFLKAGINSDDARLSYFVKGYEGDLSPDSIRKAAIDAGFIAPPSQGQDTQHIAASQQRIVNASAGAMMEGQTEAGALAALEAAMKEGGVPAMLEVARQYGVPIAN